MVEITLADKLTCARRELRLRYHVYPTHVLQGKMTQRESDYHIACMQAIVDDYERQMVAEDPAYSSALFPKEGLQ